MATISNQATGRVAGGSSGIIKYIGVGLLAVAIGVGGVLATLQLTGSSSSSTALEISQTRAAQQVTFLEAQYWAQVGNTRANDMVARFANAYAANLLAVHNARANAMVAHFANVYGPSAIEIQSQRADEMVAHFAAQFGRGLAVEQQRAQDMVDNKKGFSSLGQ